MAKQEITEEEYNNLADQKHDLEKTVKNQEVAIAQLSEAVKTTKDDTFYNKEIEGLKKRAEKAEAETKRIQAKVDKDSRERELNNEDAQKKEKARIAEIKRSTSITQSEHTRFRALEKVPAGQRDVFGNTDSPVINMGVEFDRYRGGLYLPVPTVIEIAQSLGMLTKADSEALFTSEADANARASASTKFAKELQDGINSLIGEFNDKLSAIVADVPVGDEEPDDGETKSAKASGKADHAK